VRQTLYRNDVKGTGRREKRERREEEQQTTALNEKTPAIVAMVGAF
jgi:hypothetical protein